MFQVLFHACVQVVTHQATTTDVVHTSASVTFLVVPEDQVIGQTFLILVHNRLDKAVLVVALSSIQVATSSHVNVSVSEAIRFTIAVLKELLQAIKAVKALIQSADSIQSATSSQLSSEVSVLIKVVNSHITAGFHQIQSATSSQLQAHDKSPTKSKIACCTFTLLIIAVTISQAISVPTPQYVKGALEQLVVSQDEHELLQDSQVIFLKESKEVSGVYWRRW